MAISFKPESSIKKNIGKILFFVFSLVLFLFFGSSYFYIKNNSREVGKKIEENNLKLRKTEEEKKLEEEILLYESKINLFKQLLTNHRAVFNIFKNIEASAQPKVWFTEFNFNSFENIILISGQAENFIALGEQLILLKKEKSFKEVDLSEISMLEEGRADFSFRLVLNPAIFLESSEP